jgi:phosphoribosylanthranilate isomerase
VAGVPVKVKICGVCSPDDARAAVAAGADYLGLNFHPGSPRCVTLARARAIAAAVPATALVGVFVDAARSEVERVAEALGLHALQFHGTESAAYCRGWSRPVIKAFRVRPGQAATALAAAYATEYVLIDSFVAGVPGGTGVRLDPRVAAGLAPERLFVAGGLDPDAVGEVVRALRPFAVDVASGVETAPGRKDHGKIEAFIRRAKAA